MAHGLANAIILPTVVEYNAPSDQGKYYEIYKRISQSPVSKREFRSDMLLSEIRELNHALGIPELLDKVGVKADMIDAMAEDAIVMRRIIVPTYCSFTAD